MKKSVIIITGLVYLLSIVLVAFLGFVAEIHNPPIFAEDIVMIIEDAENFPEEPYTFYYQFSPIYTVTYNPEADPAAEDDTRYSYVIEFVGDDEYKLFYDEINGLELNLHPYSPDGECENQSLSYYIDKNRQEFISVSKEGVVEFKVYDNDGSETIRVSTKDGTNIIKFIHIVW